MPKLFGSDDVTITPDNAKKRFWPIFEMGPRQTQNWGKKLLPY